MSCTAFPTRSDWWQSNSSIFTQYFQYLHSSKRAICFLANWYRLSHLSKNSSLMKKTYQFVSYVQWIPKPKRQEEIVATLCLQLTVNTRNRPINIRLKIIYITQLTTSPMISYEVSFWIPIFLRRVVEKNSMYWLSDMKMDVVHHKGIFISLFSGLHNWKWKKHYSFSPK